MGENCASSSRYLAPMTRGANVLACNHVERPRDRNKSAERAKRDGSYTGRVGSHLLSISQSRRHLLNATGSVRRYRYLLFIGHLSSIPTHTAGGAPKNTRVTSCLTYRQYASLRLPLRPLAHRRLQVFSPLLQVTCLHLGRLLHLLLLWKKTDEQALGSQKTWRDVSRMHGAQVHVGSST